MITNDAKNIITEAYGDFDTWIDTQIEKQSGEINY